MGWLVEGVLSLKSAIFEDGNFLGRGVHLRRHIEKCCNFGS